MRTISFYSMKDLRGGALRGGCLLLSSFGLLLTSTGCNQEPAPADPAITQAEPWLRQLATGDPPSRVKAVGELGRLQHPKLTKPVLYAALNDHQVQVRIAAIDALGYPNMLDEKQLKSFLYLISATDSEVRMATCRALGAMRHPASIDVLIQCMYDRESSVRLAAGDALALMGSVVTPKLADMFATGTPEQKTTIAGILAKSKDPAYASVLITALQDPNDSVRRASAEALAGIGSTSAVPALIELMRAPLSQPYMDEFKQRIRQRPSDFDFTMMVKLMDEDCDRKRIPKDRNQYPWLRSGNAHMPWFAQVIAIRQRDAANLVRDTALDALLKIAPPNLDDILLNLLADPDEDIGQLASKALRARGEDIRQRLIATAKDTGTPSLARCRTIDILAPLPEVVRKDETSKLKMVIRRLEEGVVDQEQDDETVQTNIVIVPLPPDTLNLFMAMQTDPDPRLRATIVTHLGRAGVKEAVPPLLQAFREADTVLVEKVLATLAAFKDDHIAPVLVPAIDDSRYASNLVSIVRTLGFVGDKQATPAVLRTAMKSQDLGTQSLAIEALTGINDPKAVPPMIEWFNRLQAERLELSTMVPPTGTNELQRHRSKSSNTEQLMRRLIQYFGAVKAKEAVPVLTPLLAPDSLGKYAGLASPTMTALGRIGDPRAVGPISELISKGGSYHARLYVNHITKAGIDALVVIGDPSGIPVLKKFAENWQNPQDPFTGKYAIEAMGRMRNPDAVAILVRYLTDPAVDPVMKDACVGPALAAAGLAAKPALLTLLKESPKPPERAVSDPGMYAAQILAVLERPDVNIIPDLARIMSSTPPSHIMQRAAESLAQTHHEAAVQALSNMLKSTDVPTRQLSALSLGSVKLRSAVPALEEALKDTDKKVRECAAMSLRQYGVVAAVEKKE